MKTISIVIPLYNDAARVRRALDSSVSQGANEVVVVDDCSTDGSYEIACGYPARVIRHPAKSQDHNRALEPIIESLTTDYVIALASDDWLYPGMVAAVRRALSAARGEPGMISCEFDHVNAEGQLIRTNRFSPVQVEFSPETYRAYAANYTGRPASGCTAAWRRDLLVWLQREDYASLGPWSDMWGCLLASLTAGAIYVPGPLGAFTVRPDSYSGKISRDPLLRAKYLKAAEAFLVRPAIMPIARGIKFCI